MIGFQNKTLLMQLYSPHWNCCYKLDGHRLNNFASRAVYRQMIFERYFDNIDIETILIK